MSCIQHQHWSLRVALDFFNRAVCCKRIWRYEYILRYRGYDTIHCDILLFFQSYLRKLSQHKEHTMICMKSEKKVCFCAVRISQQQFLCCSHGRFKKINHCHKSWHENYSVFEGRYNIAKHNIAISMFTIFSYTPSHYGAKMERVRFQEHAQ